MTRLEQCAANELTVLRALSQHDEPVHARRLWLSVTAVLAESSVYVVLKRLVEAGMVLTKLGARDYKGPPRPLYSLSAKGRRYLNGGAHG